MLFTWLSKNEIRVAEFLTETEWKESKNMQNISLSRCYPLFEEYLQKNTCVYNYFETVPKVKR